MTNYGPNKILDFNTSFERYFSKLSENVKIFDIGSTVLKLWLLKDFNYNSLPPFNQWFRDKYMYSKYVTLI